MHLQTRQPQHISKQIKIKAAPIRQAITIPAICPPERSEFGLVGEIVGACSVGKRVVGGFGDSDGGVGEIDARKMLGDCVAGPLVAFPASSLATGATLACAPSRSASSKSTSAARCLPARIIQCLFPETRLRQKLASGFRLQLKFFYFSRW